MPRYYGGYGQAADPQEMSQISGNPWYNPFQPGPDFYGGVMSFYQNLKNSKNEKEAKAVAEWERMLKERLTEAQINNLNEPNQRPVVDKPISKVTPVQVKTLMKRLGYPEEAITEVDSMNDPALRDTWGKLQDHFKILQTQGMKVPTTPATTKGRLQLMRLKYAQDLVEKRKATYSGALTQLLANPDKAMLTPGITEELQKKIDEIDTQAGEIASMMNNIDESGELTEDQFMKLNTILKFKSSYKPYIPTNPKPTPKPKTDAEKKLPEGFTIQK